METDSLDLNDPIAAKLRDGAAVDRVVRQAISQAVDKARNLGLLDESAIQKELDRRLELHKANPARVSLDEIASKLK